MTSSPKLCSVARASMLASLRSCATTLFWAVSVWFVAALCAPGAFADALSNAPMIFDVRRSLPLEPTEPVYHDFYINAGAEAGFRKGLYVSVVRLVPVHNPIMNKQQAELPVQIGKLQVLQVSPGITVARLITELGDDERPTLEYESVMIGDRIDTASLSTDAPKKRRNTHDRKAFDDTVVATKAEREAAARVEIRSERIEVQVPVKTAQAAPAEAKPEPKTEPKPELKAEPKAEASTKVAANDAPAKTTSPAAPATAMVPVPAPAAATR